MTAIKKTFNSIDAMEQYLKRFFAEEKARLENGITSPIRVFECTLNRNIPEDDDEEEDNEMKDGSDVASGGHVSDQESSDGRRGQKRKPDPPSEGSQDTDLYGGPSTSKIPKPAPPPPPQVNIRPHMPYVMGLRNPGTGRPDWDAMRALPLYRPALPPAEPLRPNLSEHSAATGSILAASSRQTMRQDLHTHGKRGRKKEYLLSRGYTKAGHQYVPQYGTYSYASGSQTPQAGASQLTPSSFSARRWASEPDLREAGNLPPPLPEPPQQMPSFRQRRAAREAAEQERRQQIYQTLDTDDQRAQYWDIVNSNNWTQEMTNRSVLPPTTYNTMTQGQSRAKQYLQEAKGQPFRRQDRRAKFEDQSELPAVHLRNPSVLNYPILESEELDANQEEEEEEESASDAVADLSDYERIIGSYDPDEDWDYDGGSGLLL